MNRTQRLRNRMILPAALLTAVVLLLCIPALPAAQAATLSYTALGDSISTGYGLANAEQEGFAALLAEEKGYILSNHAANGNTATGLRAQLYNEEGNVALSVKSADVITLTVGGNDLMAVLYQVVADEYNLRNPNSEPITAKDVPDLLQKGDFSTKLAVIGVVMELLTEGSPTYILENDAFIEAVAGYGDTLEEVTAQIRTMNEDVVLVIATQYNPYKEFKDVKIRITDLSPVYYGVEAGILLLNDEIVRVAEKYGCIVADVKAAFDLSKEDLALDRPLIVEDNVSLCLNGCTLTPSRSYISSAIGAGIPSDGGLIETKGAGELTLCDCSEEGEGTINASNAAIQLLPDAAILHHGASVTVYGGTIVAGNEQMPIEVTGQNADLTLVKGNLFGDGGDAVESLSGGDLTVLGGLVQGDIRWNGKTLSITGGSLQTLSVGKSCIGLLRGVVNIKGPDSGGAALSVSGVLTVEGTAIGTPLLDTAVEVDGTGRLILSGSPNIICKTEGVAIRLTEVTAASADKAHLSFDQYTGSRLSVAIAGAENGEYLLGGVTGKADADDKCTILGIPSGHRLVYDETGGGIRLATDLLVGEGSADQPYLIGSAAELREFADRVNGGEYDAHAILNANIDLNPGMSFAADGSVTGEGVAQQWTPIGNGSHPYTGKFDGKGYTVRGLYIVSENSRVGLFGMIRNATVSNLSLENGYVKGTTYVGSIAGSFGGVIANCQSSIFVTGTDGVGGLVGECGYTGSLTGCRNSGSVSGSGIAVGGIAGNLLGSAEDCRNSGSVSGSGNYVGGIVGFASADITTCQNRGDVKGEDGVGGIAGISEATIYGCFNLGTIEGRNRVGGIVGNIYRDLRDCYNNGDVKGEDGVGGIVGNSEGKIKTVYNIGSITGSNMTGAIVGKIGYLGNIAQSCYYLEGSAACAVGIDPNLTLPAFTVAEAEQELLALLQAASEGTVWQSSPSSVGTWEYGKPALQPILAWQTPLNNAPTYTVTIPATVNTEEALALSIKAGGLAQNQRLELSVGKAEDFSLRLSSDPDVALKYTLLLGEDRKILAGDVLLSVGNTDPDAEEEAISMTILPEPAKYAGSYSDTLLFIISLKTIQE